MGLGAGVEVGTSVREAVGVSDRVTAGVTVVASVAAAGEMDVVAVAMTAATGDDADGTREEVPDPPSLSVCAPRAPNAAAAIMPLAKASHICISY